MSRSAAPPLRGLPPYSFRGRFLLIAQCRSPASRALALLLPQMAFCLSRSAAPPLRGLSPCSFRGRFLLIAQCRSPASRALALLLPRTIFCLSRSAAPPLRGLAVGLSPYKITVHPTCLQAGRGLFCDFALLDAFVHIITHSTLEANISGKKAPANRPHPSDDFSAPVQILIQQTSTAPAARSSPATASIVLPVVSMSSASRIRFPSTRSLLA